MSSLSKRRETDLMKLLMSDYKVEMISDSMDEFNVEFHGPSDCPYQGSVWKIRVKLSDSYPYYPSSIEFVNKIYHPNVDEKSGAVCLDVILINGAQCSEAAFLILGDKASYLQRVKEYCEKYAKPGDIGSETKEEPNDEELSDEHYSSSDDEIDGNADS